MHRKRKHRVKIFLRILLVIVLVFTAIIGLLVYAALHSDFLQRLPLFQHLTEEEYAEQVQDEDVLENGNCMGVLGDGFYRLSVRRRVTMQSEDGYELVAMEFPEYSSDLGEPMFTETHKWVITLHGFTGTKREMYPFAYWYHLQGFNVLDPDLRCQGESDGDFIGMGYTDSQDVLLWIDEILKIDPEAEIVIHGESMGAATALMLSGMEDLPEQVKCIVSDCAYTDAYTIMKEKISDWFHVPGGPLADCVSWALKAAGGYDLKDASALEAVQKSDTPTLFIHGKEDKMIPVSMCLELYQAASCEKEIMLVEGAGHAQSKDKDPVAYFDRVSGFVGQFIE